MSLQYSIRLHNRSFVSVGSNRNSATLLLDIKCAPRKMKNEKMVGHFLWCFKYRNERLVRASVTKTSCLFN